MEMVSAMLINSNLPLSFWGEALFTACHIGNRILHKGYDKTPYELLKGRRPNINYLKVWGCIAYVIDLSQRRPKCGTKGVRSIFLGYPPNSKAYRFLNQKTNSILESTSAEFF